ncbi:MAG: N-acetylmuramoyl-L-alanine amidase [Lysobacter sp.]|nr:N-acetylmuramoyl-L-alanine amidase [Lysobacter sp.]
MQTIVIDPGHGGSRRIGGSSPNNAIGSNGTLEKTLTLDVALRLKPLLLDAGFDAVLTRETDVNRGLATRAHVARDRKASVFVSIHFNGFDGRVQGTETYIHSTAGKRSLELALLVQQSVRGATGLKDRGVKRASFGVLNAAEHHKQTAACLVEVSFLDVPAEATRLAKAAYRQAIAKALLAAIQTFLSAAKTAIRKPLPDATRHEPEDGYELTVRRDSENL